MAEINGLKKKWIKFKNGNLNFRKENGALIVENNSDTHGFLIIPQLFKIKKQHTQVVFRGEVLSGNSVMFHAFNRKGEELGQVSFESEGLIYNEDCNYCLFAVKILPKTKVRIDRLDIEFVEEANAFFNNTLTESDILVITPSYPSLENKYLSGFVHSRLMEYKKNGLKFDVVCSHAYQECCKYNFEGIDVLRVPFLELRNILRKRKYKKILVHFFDYKYANVLDSCDLKGAALYLWVHGPETLYWDWPKFTTPYFKPDNPISEEDRSRFELNDLLVSRYNSMENVTWIFVSEWIKEQSQKLIGIEFKNYVVIPNIIDEQTFNYVPKDPELRKKIYFLRRFDNCNKYAIDVNVKCILELSRRECFSDMEFNIYGRGDTYETLIAPLRQFSNVHFYPQFFTHEEIAQIHKENGIGLFATRYDAQGVSMCEAAMSGLAIVSSVNGAIEEFLPNDIGLLAETENYVQYAGIIEKMYDDPEFFQKCSEQCHKKVAEKCSFSKTVKKEIELFSSEGEKRTIEKITGVESPILSVVIPSYNVEDFLSQGVKTILNHNNAGKIEIIIVNDGSKDHTTQVARELMDTYNIGEYPVIKLIDKENGGHGSTINEGLKVSTGKYFRVIDGDDWVDSENLEKLIGILEREESDIVMTDYSEDHATVNELINKKIYEFMIPGQQYIFEDLCYPGYGFDEWGPILATSCFKTQMMKDTQFKLTEKCFYVDMEFDVYSIVNARTVTYYPLDIYRYFIGRVGQSVSKRSFMRNHEQHAKVLFNILEYLKTIPNISQGKRSYILDKVVVPMTKAHYLIVGTYWTKRRFFVNFDKRLKNYGEIYHHPAVANRFVKFHRRTGAFLLKFNTVLIKIKRVVVR